MTSTGSGLTPELLADVQSPEAVQLDATGSRYVYNLRVASCRPKDTIVSSLWIGDVQDKNQHQLTRGNYHDHSPVFSPGDQSVTFLSDRDDPGKRSRIWILPVRGHGGEAYPFFGDESDDKDKAQQDPPKDWESKPEGKGVTIFKYSPDGKKLAFLSVDEDSPGRKKQLEEDKDDVKVYGENWDFVRLRIVDLESKTVVAVDTKDTSVNTFDWSPDSRSICWTATSTPELDDMVFQNPWLNLLQIIGEDSVKYKRRVKLLVGTSSDLCWGQGGIRWLGTVDRDSNISARTVYGISDVSIDNESYKIERLGFGETDCAYGLRRSQDRVFVYVHSGMSEELWLLGAPVRAYTGRQKLDSWDIKLVDDKATLAYVASSVNSPPEIFISHASSNDNHRFDAHVQVTHHGQKVADHISASVSYLDYNSDDGIPIEGFYIISDKVRSSFDQKKPLPTVVLTHGGPYGHFTDRWWYDCMPWALLQDYLVLVANYRGGSGHGNGYAKTVRRAPQASWQDIPTLAKKCVAEGHVDEKRVAFHGWSQGGYLSYMAITRYRDFPFAAAIPGAGVTDWSAMAISSDVPTYETGLAGQSPWLSEASDTTDRAGSPLFHMAHIHTPVLIVHGEDDPRVPVTQAIGFHRGLLARKKESEMAIYPREGHGFPMPFERAHYVDMLKRMDRFLKKHIGDQSSKKA